LHGVVGVDSLCRMNATTATMRLRRRTPEDNGTTVPIRQKRRARISAPPLPYVYLWSGDAFLAAMTAAGHSIESTRERIGRSSRTVRYWAKDGHQPDGGDVQLLVDLFGVPSETFFVKVPREGVADERPDASPPSP
jgi:hypothetical protein